MKVDPIEKIMLSRFVELFDVNLLKAPTWRGSCRCFTTDSLSWGYLGQLFRLWLVRNSMMNARDSKFILVQALDRDRVIALRPVGVSLLRWYVVLYLTGVPIVSLYINREDYGAVIILVGSKEGVLV
jgi:hypothetical protein